MRKVLAGIAMFAALFMLAPAFAGQDGVTTTNTPGVNIHLEDIRTNMPALVLMKDGSGFLLFDRTGASLAYDEAYWALNELKQEMPGILTSFYRFLLQDPELKKQDGILLPGATTEERRRIQARLNYWADLELRPLLESVEREEVPQPPVWYSGPVGGGPLTTKMVGIICGPCKDGENPGVWCQMYRQCIIDCGGDGKVCQVEPAIGDDPAKNYLEPRW